MPIALNTSVVWRMWARRLYSGFVIRSFDWPPCLIPGFRGNTFGLFKRMIYLLAVVVFLAAHRDSLVGPGGGYSLLWCMGFSRQGLLLLQRTVLGMQTSAVAAHRLSCSTACGIFPKKTLNQCPCLARQILNHGPPGKPSVFHLWVCQMWNYHIWVLLSWGSFLYVHFLEIFYHKWILNVIKKLSLNLLRWSYGF